MNRTERENRAVLNARELLPKIYEKYPTGGPLHIVIDDGNLRTCDIVWCLVHLMDKDVDEDDLPEEDANMFMKFAEYLLDMPESKRYRVFWRDADALDGLRL